MNRTVNKGRLAVLAVIIVILLFVYIAFLYDLQIIQGEEYYLRSSETKVKDETVPASRGNILDRYGRVLVSNEECYNLTIDVTKLFADGSEAANKTILDLINLVDEHGDVYIDDLPITKAPPFEYTEMTEIQKNMDMVYSIFPRLGERAKQLAATMWIRTVI